MTFILDINRWVKKANDDVDKAVRRILIAIPTSIIKRNPVGDANYWKSSPPKGYVGGRSRANWQYGNGAMPRGTLDVIDRTGNKTIADIKAKIDTAPTASMHWFVNNLDYIQRLENGYSRQAPNGMVKITVLDFQKFAREAVNGRG